LTTIYQYYAGKSIPQV